MYLVCTYILYTGIKESVLIREVFISEGEMYGSN